MKDWVHAFLLTEGIEVPIYLVWAWGLPWPRRGILALGASAITHPIVWGIVLSGLAPYEVLCAVAEAFAVATEAAWAVRLGLDLRRAIAASVIANGCSVLVGLAIQ